MPAQEVRHRDCDDDIYRRGERERGLEVRLPAYTHMRSGGSITVQERRRARAWGMSDAPGS